MRYCEGRDPKGGIPRAGRALIKQGALQMLHCVAEDLGQVETVDTDSATLLSSH
jgi:hypothetical protein